jgi:hypothetical protein
MIQLNSVALPRQRGKNCAPLTAFRPPIMNRLRMFCQLSDNSFFLPGLFVWSILRSEKELLLIRVNATRSIQGETI